jgi:hypothetical protein
VFEWVTDQYEVSSEERDFTGDYSISFLHSATAENIIIGAIPYSLEDYEDLSSDFTFSYWAECVDETEEEHQAELDAIQAELDAEIEAELEAEIASEVQSEEGGEDGEEG